MSPNVSVIIPAYEAEAFLERAVRSAVRGAPTGTEVIVVDDGSTDDTGTVARETCGEIAERTRDVRARVVRHRENRGKAAAINTGLAAAAGDVIGVLDADDEYEDGGLAALYDALAGVSDPFSVSIGGFKVVDESGSVVGQRRSPSTTAPQSLKRRVAFGWKTPFHFNACLVSAATYEAIAPFSADLGRVVDIDMSLGVLDQVSSVRLVDDHVYRYRKHRDRAGERVRVRWRTLRLRNKVLRRHFSGPAGFLGSLWMAAADTIKLGYELVANYTS